jgi:ferredoxin-nitrate reductase
MGIQQPGLILVHQHFFKQAIGQGQAAIIEGQSQLVGPAPLPPLVLTVGRYLGHWHTMTRTTHVKRLIKQHPEALLEVHPLDARRYCLQDGQWAEVRSRRASIQERVLETQRIHEGTVFLPMHWGASQGTPCEANRLMHEEACVHFKQPELKASAVMIVSA